MGDGSTLPYRFELGLKMKKNSAINNVSATVCMITSKNKFNGFKNFFFFIMQAPSGPLLSKKLKNVDFRFRGKQCCLPKLLFLDFRSPLQRGRGIGSFFVRPNVTKCQTLNFAIEHDDAGDSVNIFKRLWQYQLFLELSVHESFNIVFFQVDNFGVVLIRHHAPK